MVPRGPADAPAATASDRFYFNCFRATVGVVVLGLVVATYAAVLPLLMQTAMGDAVPRNATKTNAAAGIGLTRIGWTDHDSEAARGILIISSAQACLLLVGFLCFRYHRARGAEAAEVGARALRRDATRRMRVREKQRVQQQQQLQEAREQGREVPFRRRPAAQPDAVDLLSGQPAV